MTDDQLYDVFLRFYVKVCAGGPLTDHEFTRLGEGENGALLSGRALVAAALGARYAKDSERSGLASKDKLIREIDAQLKTQQPPPNNRAG